MAAPALTARDRVAHLLRRTSFAVQPADVDAAAARGYEGSVHDIVNGPGPGSRFDEVLDNLQADFLDTRNFADLQIWWLNRMLHTDAPLQEKMTLFWHGHFTSAYSKVRSTRALYNQNRTLRDGALGNFGDIAVAMARDPAMIVYLDNQTNRAGHPNENFARELMELFTLGIGNYTEHDIREAARAFTGWSSNRLAETFVFARRLHDFGDKTVFGRTGNWDGDDVVHMCVSQPVSAQFLCRKLAKFFMNDDPPAALVASLATTFQSAGLEVKPVLTRLFTSPEFTGPGAVWQKVKSPAEFVVGALAATRAPMPIRAVPFAMRSMGQELFNPPNVKGWDGGMSWINTNTLLARFNFAMLLARQNLANDTLMSSIDARLTAAGSVTSLIDHWSDTLLQRSLTPHSRSVLTRYAETGPALAGQQQRGAGATLMKAHGLLHMMMLTPEYQLV